MSQKENHSNYPQSGFSFAAGKYSVSAFFRNNKQLFLFLYFLVTSVILLILTFRIGDIVAWVLIPFMLITFILLSIYMVKNPNFFDSEEHVEISTQQQIELQGTKQIGTQEVISEGELFYPDVPQEKLSTGKTMPKNVETDKKAIRSGVTLEKVKK